MTNVIYIIENLLSLMRMKRGHYFIKMSINYMIFSICWRCKFFLKVFSIVVEIIECKINISNVHLIDQELLIDWNDWILRILIVLTRRSEIVELLIWIITSKRWLSALLTIKLLLKCKLKMKLISRR